MRKITGVLIAMVCCMALLPHSSHAASPVTLDINNQSVSSHIQPIIQNNTTYIPMRALEQIDGLHIQTWYNNTKILTIQDRVSHSTLTLQVNQKTATRNQTTLTLEQPVILVNNSLLVPMRFVAEAFGCDVAWNASTRTVYVARASSTQHSQLQSSNLTEARIAALHLPIISTLPDIQGTENSAGSISLYFPKNMSNAFFIEGDGVISYYRITDNSAQLQWQAAVSKKATANAPFYIKGIIKENGKRPVIQTNLMYYYLSTHAGLAQYGEISTSGKTTIYGEKDMNSLDELFPIEQETK